MSTLNNLLENMILATTDKTCPSLRNRMVNKLANLFSFFAFTSFIDGFIYKTEENQKDQEKKLDALAEGFSYLLDAGLTQEGAVKALQDTFKYSKSRSFSDKTVDAKSMEALVACGEDPKEIQRAIDIQNMADKIKFGATSEIIANQSDYLESQILNFVNVARHATPTLENFPVWLATSTKNKILSTVQQQRMFLRNGVIKGITTSGNELFIINFDILDGLNTYAERFDTERSQIDSAGTPVDEDGIH